MRKLEILLLLLLYLSIVGCEVHQVEPTLSLPSINKKGKKTTVLFTNQLVYPDSIVYMKPGTALLYPIQVPVGASKFSASPIGLVIDQETGVIDMTKSETGMWFTVSCQSGNTKYYTKLMISGIEYASSIYKLREGQRLAIPYYNGNPLNTMPRGSFSVDDPQVIINKGTGIINLTATAAHIAMGGYKEVIISYQLEDASNRAVNKIKVRLYNLDNLFTAFYTLIEEQRDRPPGVAIVSGGD